VQRCIVRGERCAIVQRCIVQDRLRGHVEMDHGAREGVVRACYQSSYIIYTEFHLK
jgi:hypothetical protein